MLKDKNIGILGGGSWATAIIKIIGNQRNDINWYMRDEESADYIKIHKRNPKYLSSVKINPKNVRIFTDINKIVNVSDILIYIIVYV